MKIESPPTNWTLPAASRTDLHVSSVRKTPGTRRGYDAAGVIDTVQIRRHDFRPLPITEAIRYKNAADSGKGLYIDLWA